MITIQNSLIRAIEEFFQHYTIFDGMEGLPANPWVIPDRVKLTLDYLLIKINQEQNQARLITLARRFDSIIEICEFRGYDSREIQDYRDSLAFYLPQTKIM